MLRVRDIMTPNVFTLDTDASVLEAAWALTRRSISGAPVRDAAGALVGILSKSDLVNPPAFSLQWTSCGRSRAA